MSVLSVWRAAESALSTIFGVVVAVYFTAIIATALWHMVFAKERRAPATLTAIGKEWVPRLEVVALLVLLSGVVIAIACGLLRVGHGGVAAFSGFVGSGLVSTVFYFCFYRLIRCPVCGKELNKYKNGRNMPIKSAFTALEKGAACKWCGWKPPGLNAN